MPQEYAPAPEVRQIANDLINLHHTHLSTARIEYIFLAEAPKVKGKEAMGRARVVSGLNAWLATDEYDREAAPEPFFLIEISKKHWQTLTDRQRFALVDHELSHCERDLETGKPRIVGHDVEEFAAVIRRHGLWRPEVEYFAEAAEKAKQRGLFDRDADSQVGEVMERVVDEINSGALDGDGVTVTATVKR